MKDEHQFDGAHIIDSLDTIATPAISADESHIIIRANESAAKLFECKREELILSPLVSVLDLGRVFGRGGESARPNGLQVPEPEFVCTGRRRDGVRMTLIVDLGRVSVAGRPYALLLLRECPSLLDSVPEVVSAFDDRLRASGNDLHDGIGQQLTGCSLLADALQEQLLALRPIGASELADDDFDSMLGTATRLNQLLREAASAVRDVSHGLLFRPGNMRELLEGLESLVRQIDGLPNLACQLDVRGADVGSSITTSTNLYRICQEAVNNALKHGQAGEIRITLSMDESSITLEVENDGGPFAFDTRQLGYGLQAMRYRATQIGGTLEIRPQPAGGATVRCVVPKR